MNNRYYVYVHSFPNGVFYIGKGTGKRAYVFSNRNEYYTGLLKKYGNPSVDFIIKDVDEEFAFLVEIEVLDKLKKLNLKLCNLKGGGAGVKMKSAYRKAIVIDEKYYCKSATDCGLILFEKFGENITRNIASVCRSSQKTARGITFRLAKEGDENLPEFTIDCDVDWVDTKQKDQVIDRNKIVYPRVKDKNIYKFTNETDVFVGTRVDFCNEYNLNPVTLGLLFCKNPRKSYKGWRVENVDK